MVGGGAGYAQAQPPARTPGTAGTYPRGLRPSLSSTPWFFSGSGRAGARLRACASLNEKAYRSGRPRHCLLQAGGALLSGLQPAVQSAGRLARPPADRAKAKGEANLWTATPGRPTTTARPSQTPVSLQCNDSVFILKPHASFGTCIGKAKEF